MADYTDQDGKRVVLGKLLGKGGEGAVYLISGSNGSVAKIYFPEKRDYYQPRLSIMVGKPPEDATRKMTPPHISIAWPEKCLFQGSKFVGYTMPIIQKAPDIFKIYAPSLRRQELPNFNWYHLHHVALNLAIAVNAYHAAGYVIGDLNSKNVKVHSTAMVTMIDTDSVQMHGTNGKILRCPVGTPDFTAPELQGLKLDEYDRDVYHDAFALAVMIFLLLMEGTHPYTGKPVSPSFSSNMPVIQYCMKSNIFPFGKNTQFVPPKNAPDFNCLHPDLQALFTRCFAQSFGSKRTNRPLPIEWYRTLSKVETELVKCKQGHMYYPGYGKCPWCEREAHLAAISVHSSIPVQNPAKPMPPSTPPRAPRPAPSTPRYNQPTPVPTTVKRGYVPPQKHSSPVKAIAIVGSIAVGGYVLYSILNSVLAGAGSGTLIPTLNNAYQNAAQNTATDPSAAGGYATASCPGAAYLLNSIGNVVTVRTSTSLRGHSSADLSGDSVIIRYAYGDQLTIVDGPMCVTNDSSAQYWMWKVRDNYGNESWVAEGDSSLYFIQ